VTTADDPVIQIALARGLLRPECLARARRKALGPLDPTAVRPGLLTILLRDGALDEVALARALAEEWDLPFVVLATCAIAPAICARLPMALAREHGVMPFGLVDGVLQVAVTAPPDEEVQEQLAFAAGTAIQLALAAGADIRSALDRHYGAETDRWAAPDGPEIFPVNAPVASPYDEVEPGQVREAGESDAVIIRLVEAILAEAIHRRASDIHVEPLARRLRVRYRVDGVLREGESPPLRLQPAIISCLKIMANINIAEKRVPQDGRLRFEFAGRALDLRVSVLPTVYGESLVLRLLDREGLKLGLPDLGLSPDDQRGFERILAAPDGLMLVTGPTGSGKTTSLYTALQSLNRPEVKIITVEDPVEYQLTGINQVAVNPGTGLTFAAALRALLRQAPNIVMVGEIRDRETAEIALQAALTGHQVMSTLHTTDAPGAVARLIDLGAKPFLVAAALRAVVAQRLVRRICPRCRCAYTPAVRELHALGLTAPQVDGAEFAHGVGCAACHGTGYRGRVGLFELLIVSDGMRPLIYDNVTAARLRQQARREGLRTLREDGLSKMLAGLTTIEEIVAATVGATH
jgi:type IV pilus assembly protein PilB